MMDLPGGDFDQLFDYQQNVARASFDDMVHDEERNHLYYYAIKKSIDRLRRENTQNEVFAFDIGSGTGLLSMMAALAGADRILSCERFEPMAECSRKIIETNKMSDRIQVIGKDSTEVKIQDNKLPNLLVAELLDTELIGEGCLFAYRDAIKRLVDPKALFVPSRARIWAQLVQSDLLFNYHQYKQSYSITYDPKTKVQTPKSIINCFGSHLLQDLQMSRLKPGKDFEILSEPIKIFDFEFSNLKSMSKDFVHKRIRLPLKQKFNKPIMVFSWWDIDLDDEGEIKLSCAPFWARDTYSSVLAWREHWLQSIYFLPAFAFNEFNQVDGFSHDEINKSGHLWLDGFHDSFSIWFDLPDQDPDPNELLDEQSNWYCVCTHHSHLARSRLYWLNDDEQHRYEKYWITIDRAPSTNRIQLIYFGCESILPFIISQHSLVNKVWLIIIHTKELQQERFFQEFIDENPHLYSKIELVKFDEHRNTQFETIGKHCGTSVLLTDFHFRCYDSQFPSLLIFNQVLELRKNLQIQMEFCLPSRIVIKCLLVRFEHLWKCFQPVKQTTIPNQKPLSMEHYDDLIMNARKQVDCPFDKRYCWEYSSWPLIPEPLDLFEFNLKIDDQTVSEEKTLRKTIKISAEFIDKEIHRESVAFVCWPEFYLTNDDDPLVISGGLLPNQRSFSQENEIQWTRYDQQSVKFLSSEEMDKFLQNQIEHFEFELKIHKDFVKNSLKLNIFQK